MRESFVVDWQDCNTSKPAASVVSIRMRGRKAGLYRVKQFMFDGMLLSHGAISFPVGTRLEIEDPHGLVSGMRHCAQVVANDPNGVSLAW